MQSCLESGMDEIMIILLIIATIKGVLTTCHTMYWFKNIVCNHLVSSSWQTIRITVAEAREGKPLPKVMQ